MMEYNSEIRKSIFRYTARKIKADFPVQVSDSHDVGGVQSMSDIDLRPL